MHKHQWKQLISGFALLLLVGCSGSSDAVPETTTLPAATTLVVDTSTSSTSTTSTTIPVSPKESLDQLADSMKAIDYSRISQGDCGTFAMIVTRKDLWFFEYDWDFRQWVDKSFLLGEPLGSKPIRVTTRDYTGDNVNEFLVAYGDNLDVMSSGREYGGIFAYPPYRDDEFKCRWGWVDLASGYGVSTVMDWLGYDDDYEVIRAQNFYEGGGRTFGVLTYDYHSHAFFFTPDEVLD